MLPISIVLIAAVLVVSIHGGHLGLDGGYAVGHQGIGDLGDYHKGLSIVGGISDQGHKTSIDLTQHGGGGGGGHQGPFGGSFVASSKYNSNDGHGHGQVHYTDVLQSGGDEGFHDNVHFQSDQIQIPEGHEGLILSGHNVY